MFPTGTRFIKKATEEAFTLWRKPCCSEHFLSSNVDTKFEIYKQSEKYGSARIIIQSPHKKTRTSVFHQLDNLRVQPTSSFKSRYSYMEAEVNNREDPQLLALLLFIGSCDLSFNNSVSVDCVYIPSPYFKLFDTMLSYGFSPKFNHLPNLFFEESQMNFYYKSALTKGLFWSCPLALLQHNLENTINEWFDRESTC